MTDVAAAIEALSARIDALESENAQLRADAAPKAPKSVSRRGMLRLGAVGAAAATSAVLLRPSGAGASTPDILMGDTNDAGAGATILTSTATDGTFEIDNTGSAGKALYVHSTGAANADRALYAQHDGTGEALVGWQSNANSGASAVHGVTEGSGATIWATQNGTGVALRGETVNGRGLDVFVRGSANDHIGSVIQHNGTGEGQYVLQNNGNAQASAIHARAKGLGAAIEGSSDKGDGGRFKGKTSQVYLVPSPSPTHPTSGQAGQLFVDKSARLWYCLGGTKWKQLA